MKPLKELSYGFIEDLKVGRNDDNIMCVFFEILRGNKISVLSSDIIFKGTKRCSRLMWRHQLTV